MRALFIVVAVAGGACSKGPSSTGCPELDAFEKLHDGRPYNDVYIAKCGIYLARKQLVAPGELSSSNALRATLEKQKPPPELIVLDIDDQPVAVASAILRSLAGMKIEMGQRTHEAGDSFGVERFSVVTFDQPLRADPRLSVDVVSDRVFVGITPLNEFQEIPNRDDAIDWDKLEITLKEHKASALFAARANVELAVDPTLASGAMIHALSVLSNAGFDHVSILPREKLSAQAYIPPIVDIGALPSVDAISAALRAHAGKDGIEIRAGKEHVCDYVRVVAEPTPSAKRGKDKPGDGHQVVVIHADGKATEAYQFTPALDDKDPGYTSGRHEVTAEALEGYVNNDRIGNPVKKVPVEIAAEARVTAAQLVTALTATCRTRLVESIQLRAPDKLSIDPTKMPLREN